MGKWEGSLGCEFSCWSFCAEGMGSRRRWVRWVLSGDQGVPVGIQECLERFHRRCVDYLSRQFVPEWDSPNGEGELVLARTASLLVGLECVVA